MVVAEQKCKKNGKMSTLHIQLWGNEAISKPRKVRDCRKDRLQH